MLDPGGDFEGCCTKNADWNFYPCDTIFPTITHVHRDKTCDTHSQCEWSMDPAVCGDPDPAADCCIPTEQNSGNNGYDCSIAGLQFNDKCTLPNTQNNCFWDTSNPFCTPEPQGCCEPTEQNSGSGASYDCTILGLNNAGKCTPNNTQNNCDWNPSC